MRYASFLKSSGWDSKFRFSTTRGGPSVLPYYRACLVWTQSWVRSITKCATKLILNCRHWDQSIHNYPPIISLQRPRGNPVFEYHQSPKTNLWESARIPFMQRLLVQCPCAHKSPDHSVSFGGWFRAPIGYVWLLLRPPADPIYVLVVWGSYFAVIYKLLLFWINVCSSLQQRLYCRYQW